MTNHVTASFNFIDHAFTGGPTQYVDLRTPMAGPDTRQTIDISVKDARGASDLGLESSGFTLCRQPSKVTDFYDCADVMQTYYTECRSLAEELTGAHTTFTFDHIIREPGHQFSGGGTDSTLQKSGIQAGGGYINSVHMDYTDNSTWDKYLNVHGKRTPVGATRVYALNFWRPLSDSVDDQPLAVCDARTVQADDLQEVVISGYGAKNYSWHDIGIETYSVSTSDRQQWYYYPGMTPEDVLIIKSYDSEGVIGNTCPHASFAHPSPKGESRRSIELRVLCFC
ncbi:MAG: hypothetical protein ACI9ON_002523 [Limisphaerales bacterium]|jgi:hypothetical protein